MNIMVFTKSKLPAIKYGGTERVVWDLVYSLRKLNYQVTLMAGKGTTCHWARVIEYNPKESLENQVPDNIDIVHFHSSYEPVKQPYIITQHGNSLDVIDPNTVFVSQNHAQQHGAEAYVYNGLNWNNYPALEKNITRRHFHFLGKASWRVKNVKGAINIAKKSKKRLLVLGGHRLNFKMGFRFTLHPEIKFLGMADNALKARAMNQSNGLLFPVTWHEPFGLAIIESLYYGCPVYGTPYGSLPELVGKEYGYLSLNENKIVESMQDFCFDPLSNHEYAKEVFNSDVMAMNYLKLYEKAINGYALNESINSFERKFKGLPYNT